MTSQMARLQRVALWLGAVSYIAVGVMHFTHEAFFVRIVPPALPFPQTLVHVSGVAEILGGLGLLWLPTRRWASYGLVALLVAVYPANIYMALEPTQFRDLAPPLALYLRLPLQVIFIAWALWVGRYRDGARGARRA